MADYFLVAESAGLPARLFSSYGALALFGILLTAFVWSRVLKGEPRAGGRLTLIYFIGLGGAIVGAKIAFLIAEGWHYADDWVALLTGRSILGALLGGYAAVEIGKRWLGYIGTTGDRFAVVVPIGIAVGRMGCLLDGCCLGVVCSEAWWTMRDGAGMPRWPAPLTEQAFNLAFLAWVVVAANKRWLPGNRFHVYMMAYGVFRFFHEFARDDVRWFGRFDGYHLLALALAIIGFIRFRGRVRLCPAIRAHS